MTMPAGIATVTVTGQYVRPDGTPLKGKITFSTPALLTLAGADTVATGSVTLTLDTLGMFTVVLVATDNPSMQPTGWVYTVTEKFDEFPGRTYALDLPSSVSVVQIADVSPANPGQLNYIPVAGPAGAAGAAGADGKSILSGHGAPSNGTGNNGDFWLDLDAVALYGPRNNGTWPGTGVSLGAGGLSTTVNDLGTRTTALETWKTATDTKVTANEAAVTAFKRRAIRRGGIADPALADALYSGSAPTITTAQSTTSSISSAVKYTPPLVTLAGSDVRGDFLFVGATDFQIGGSAPDTSYALPTSKYPHTYASGQSAWSFEFVTDADAFELRFKYIGTSSMYKLTIDGKALTATPVSVGGTTIGSGHMLKVAFGSAALRRVRVDLFTVPFGGIYIGPTFQLWRPVSTRGRFMVLGDSITDGSGQNAGQGIGTWLYSAARMMGITDVWDQARGGTGYITPGAYAIFGDRLAADVTAYSPDVLIIKGGYNDNGGNQSSISTAAASLYAAAKTALPNTQIIVAGPHAPTASPATSITNTDNTLQAAATAAGLPYISLVTGNTYNGTGTVVSTQSPYITAANVATAIGVDGIHPTDAGHAILARWMVRALAPVLPL
ncbi:SGNH/GDSL hydrolase family protein [Streptomyces sp. NPDC005302]|uniref:SGNH/GDSL hydrolase family protein n=1 Tax=Streptomyces sp. NPDC005302 TaxID=3154675 RepID=UPI0033A0D87D